MEGRLIFLLGTFQAITLVTHGFQASRRLRIATSVMRSYSHVMNAATSRKLGQKTLRLEARLEIVPQLF